MVYEGNHRLGDLFKSRKEKGKSGLPTISVTLTNGLVDRDSLDRKTDTALSEAEHLLVKKGDIAYNMMRMWQGASGLAEKDGIVSPAYVVLAPKKIVDSRYAAYLFKSQRLIYLFWAYSYGLTADRLRLYFGDFAKIPVNIPIVEVQAKIAEILSTWDKAIETTEKLIANSKAQKKALIQQLLTGKKRFTGFGGKWKKRCLGKIASVIVSNVDKKSNVDEFPVLLCNYTEVYYNDYIRKNTDFMEATAAQREIAKFSLRKGDVVITKDSESPDDIAIPALVRDELSNVVCGYHLAIVRPKLDVSNGGFLSCLFSLPRVRHYFFSLANGATRFGLSVSAIEGAEFSIPSIEEQCRISELVMCLDDEAYNLSLQLEALKKQKAALMQQLLTGKRRVKLDSAA